MRPSSTCWAAARRSSAARSRPSSRVTCSRPCLLDGFLPACGPSDLPARGRRTGLTEIGLPYAADAAITRHLARFLGQQAGLAALRRSARSCRRPCFSTAASSRPRNCAGESSTFSRAGPAAACPSSSHPTWTSPSPMVPPITVRFAAAEVYGFAAAFRARITSGSRRPRRRSPALHRRSRRSASCPWAWKKAPRPTFPAPRSA